ncbi:oxygen-independent coproporphyrinogen III oxidase [Maribellus comscasis]|uniref:oxygen-independent coproporphyrinogen III oxidase n=1 Tax=Maribellus comscasis TaxID=2681766 RepID=UPI001C2D1A37|nr:oxygen-independent coproporphyrinogen III oxidase [Maribellus comscasis]
MKIPKNLIDKYNVPVPRYTSYPPANFFSTEFDNKEYIRAIEFSNNEWPENISIYIHIPFCPKICYYCGCNTHLTRDKDKMRVYVEALKKEILMVKKYLSSNRKVAQVHWGGGTPNSLPVEMMEEIMGVLHSNFSFIPNPEIAMECHPAMLDSAYIDALVKSGFNRMSLGIQDFNLKVLENVNRDPSEIPVEELVQLIRSRGDIGVNLDFIYGLPYQDVKSFSETIEQAVKISPDRLVTFSYAHVPWIKKAQKILEVRGLPEADEKLAMFEAAYKILTQNGYKPIGLDHYAKADDELNIALENRTLHRNFQGYCTRETTGQVYAFGATGISQLESAYAQNAKDTNKYVEQIESGNFFIEKGYKLSKKEKIIKHVINEIMCNYYLSWKEAAQKFEVSEDELKNVVELKEGNLDNFAEDGLLNFNPDEIAVTDSGRFFVRNIAASFDPNLKNAAQKFSKSL